MDAMVVIIGTTEEGASSESPNKSIRGGTSEAASGAKVDDVIHGPKSCQNRTEGNGRRNVKVWNYLSTFINLLSIRVGEYLGKFCSLLNGKFHFCLPPGN